MVISENDLRLNYFFRGGNPKLTFEYGQTQVPEWEGKTEAEVLIERVMSRKKPVASIAHGPGEDLWEKISNISGCRCERSTNEWGMHMIYLTAYPAHTTLLDLARERAVADLGTIPVGQRIPWLGKGTKRTVWSYLKGFDMSSEIPEYRVSMEESALLLGYPWTLGHNWDGRIL